MNVVVLTQQVAVAAFSSCVRRREKREKTKTLLVQQGGSGVCVCVCAMSEDAADVV